MTAGARDSTRSPHSDSIFKWRFTVKPTNRKFNLRRRGAEHLKESSLARPFMGHRIDSKILVVFLTLTAAGLGLLWLAAEVLEGDTFAIDRAILRGLRTGANSAIPVGRRGSLIR